MATNGYTADREWSDQFIPAIKQIVGPLLLVPAPFEVDTREATDLIVFRGRDVRVAARVRRHHYDVEEFRYQFTLRFSRTSGAETEYDKLAKGWCDWLFYGWALNDGSGVANIARWYLIDLAAWRYQLIQKGTRERIQCGVKRNGDGTTSFIWYNLRTFAAQPSVLIASSHDLRVRVANEQQHQQLNFLPADQ